MAKKISYKYLLKSLLPNWGLSYARGLRSWMNARNYWSAYVFKGGRANPPVSIALETTYRCNLQCAMCPQAIDLRNAESNMRAQMAENEELHTREIVEVVREARKFGVKNLTVTGGEPFLRKDILEIVSSIKRNNMACYIISNGGLISEQIAREIVKIGVDKITFSLDGPETVHNRIRGNNMVYQNLINGIRVIQSEKKKSGKNIPDISFSMTVSNLNSGTLCDVVDIAKKEGVSVNFGFVFYTSKTMKERTEKLFPASGGKFEDQDIPFEIRRVDPELLSMEIGKAKNKANSLGVKINIRPPLEDPVNIRKRFYDDEYAFVTTCFYPWYAMRINPYGEVYPCQMNVKMGNVREQKIEDIWNSDTYIAFRKELRKSGIWPSCRKCCALNDTLWDRLPKMRWYWEK